MKKLFCIILTLALVISFSPSQAFADYTHTDGNNTNTYKGGIRSGDYVYTLDSGNKAAVVAYLGKAVNVIIPSTIDGHPVIAVTGGFGGLEFIETIVIPEGVTEIGRVAFWVCTNLTSITFPSSLTTIGEAAFQSCENLKTVILPNGIKSIADSTFVNCSSLMSVNIPSSVTSIGVIAFKNCNSLKSITIPSSVTSIAARAFKGCSSLASVTIANSNTAIGDEAFDNTPWYAKDNEFTIDANGVLTGYHGLGGDIVIPSTVKVINRNVFPHNQLITSVTISEGVTLIEDTVPGLSEHGAFFSCSNLKSVTIPSSMTHIGDSAFYMCENLKSINIPSSITSISPETFGQCESLESILLPNSITKIGSGAFRCAGLKSITIPSSVKTIGGDAFISCNMTEITIPSTVTLLENGSPCADCLKLTAINVDSNNPNYASVDGVLFNKDKTRLIQYPTNKNNTSYTVPTSVNTIDGQAFTYAKNLVGLTLPNGITEIGDHQFLWCENLKSLIIPSSVTSIRHYAFRDCLSLTSLTIPPSVTHADGDLFKYCPKNLKIYGAAGSLAEIIAKDNNFAFVNGPAPAPAPIPAPKPETAPTPVDNRLPALPSPTKMVVNSGNVAVDSYIINGNNYIKLRDLSTMVNKTGKNFNVTWDGEKNAINLISSTPYTSVGGEMTKGNGSSKKAAPTTSTIYIDGKVVALTAYNINDNNYFKLRDVMKAFDIAVGYDDATKTATLDTSKGYVAP